MVFCYVSLCCCSVTTSRQGSRRDRDRDRDGSQPPPQQRACHATGGDVSGDEDEPAFDYGDDFNSGDGDDDDDDVHALNGDDELSCLANMGADGGGDGNGDGEGEKGTDGDDLDATLRMALMSTPSDVPTHRPSQCET